MSDAGDAVTAEQPSIGSGTKIRFKLSFGKLVDEIELCPASATVRDVKRIAYERHGVPVEMQKLLSGGKMMHDAATLQEAGVRKGMKLMLIGSKPTDILAAAAPEGKASMLADDVQVEVKDPVHTETQHRKILDKGQPEGMMPGIAGRQVPLGEHENIITGLLNGKGEKVRMTFRPAERQLWIGSATTTRKLHYAQVLKVENHPIPEHERWSMVALHLSAEGKGRLWFYWFPSQYVAAIKMRLIGVQALI